MGKTIVLIESGVTADAIEKKLTAEGYNVHTAHDRVSAIKLLRNGSFDALIVNPEVLEMTCDTFRGKIRVRVGNEFPIVLLSTWSSLASCRACRAVFGTSLRCVDEPVEPDDVLHQLYQLFERQPYQQVNGKEAPNGAPLSRREKEVLALLRHGLTNREIALRLYIVEKVVEKHIANICCKLGVRNRTEAVALSYRRQVM